MVWLLSWPLLQLTRVLDESSQGTKPPFWASSVGPPAREPNGLDLARPSGSFGGGLRRAPNSPKQATSIKTLGPKVGILYMEFTDLEP